jgi:hypothetical protein
MSLAKQRKEWKTHRLSTDHYLPFPSDQRRQNVGHLEPRSIMKMSSRLQRHRDCIQSGSREVRSGQTVLLIIFDASNADMKQSRVDKRTLSAIHWPDNIQITIFPEDIDIPHRCFDVLSTSGRYNVDMRQRQLGQATSTDSATPSRR